MKMATVSSHQGDDKYAAPSGNQKLAKTGIGHLIVSGMDFSSKHSFGIKDFVDKAEEENCRWRLMLGWICCDAHNTFLTLYEEL